MSAQPPATLAERLFSWLDQQLREMPLAFHIRFLFFLNVAEQDLLGRFVEQFRKAKAPHRTTLNDSLRSYRPKEGDNEKPPFARVGYLAAVLGNREARDLFNVRKYDALFDEIRLFLLSVRKDAAAKDRIKDHLSKITAGAASLLSEREAQIALADLKRFLRESFSMTSSSRANASVSETATLSSMSIAQKRPPLPTPWKQDPDVPRFSDTPELPSSVVEALGLIGRIDEVVRNEDFFHAEREQGVWTCSSQDALRFAQVMFYCRMEINRVYLSLRNVVDAPGTFWVSDYRVPKISKLREELLERGGKLEVFENEYRAWSRKTDNCSS